MPTLQITEDFNVLKISAKAISQASATKAQGEKLSSRVFGHY
jgi:hypothetical protein